MVNTTIMGPGLPYPKDPLSRLAFDLMNAPQSSVQRRLLSNQFYTKVKALATKCVESYNKINPTYQSIVVDQIVERVFLYLHTFKFASSIKTWINSIARRLCLDFFKGRLFNEEEITDPITFGDENTAGNEEQYALMGLTPPEFIDSRTPEGILLSKESRERVRRAIERLTLEDKDIVTLIFLRGYSSKEVGEIYRLEKSTLSHRKKRILKTLRSTI